MSGELTCPKDGCEQTILPPTGEGYGLGRPGSSEIAWQPKQTTHCPSCESLVERRGNGWRLVATGSASAGA